MPIRKVYSNVVMQYLDRPYLTLPNDQVSECFRVLSIRFESALPAKEFLVSGIDLPCLT